MSTGVLEVPQRRGRDAARVPARRSPVLVTQLSWFVGAGVVSTLLQDGIYLGLRSLWAPAVASLISLVISTVFNTELHRKWTFAGSRAGVWRAHVEAGIAAAAVYGLSMLLLGVIDGTWTQLTPVGEALVITAVTAGLGLLRFAVLRRWVFRLPRHAD